MRGMNIPLLLLLLLLLLLKLMTKDGRQADE
jgi:hypothetical protein